jgi:hypothetical protein
MERTHPNQLLISTLSRPPVVSRFSSPQEKPIEYTDQFFIQLDNQKLRIRGPRTFESDDPLLLPIQEQLQMLSFSLANISDPFHDLVYHLC